MLSNSEHAPTGVIYHLLANSVCLSVCEYALLKGKRLDLPTPNLVNNAWQPLACIYPKVKRSRQGYAVTICAAGVGTCVSIGLLNPLMHKVAKMVTQNNGVRRHTGLTRGF